MNHLFYSFLLCRYLIWYLAWRCMHGLHKEIQLNFMIVGHTKFSADWCFGLLKSHYQISQVSTLGDIEEVVKSSSDGINIPQLVGSEAGEQKVPMYPWQEFLSPHFRPTPGIKKYQHCRYVPIC